MATDKTIEAEKSLPPKQAEVYKLLSQNKTPQEIAGRMKISVNGVYGHMRRIESHGLDLSQFRSSNGRPRNGAGGKRRTRAQRTRRSTAIHDPAIERLLKNLDTDEAALKSQKQKHQDEAKKLEAELQQHTNAGSEIENGLLAIAAAREHVK